MVQKFAPRRESNPQPPRRSGPSAAAPRGRQINLQDRNHRIETAASFYYIVMMNVSGLTMNLVYVGRTHIMN